MITLVWWLVFTPRPMYYLYILSTTWEIKIFCLLYLVSRTDKSVFPKDKFLVKGQMSHNYCWIFHINLRMSLSTKSGFPTEIEIGKQNI